MSEHAAPSARRARPGEPLPGSFYDRDTEQVARDLLGCTLVCHSDQGTTAGCIVETEAYLGPHDPACHAVAGLTERTRWLYGPPGRAYVYFIYGVHWCFNAVTREEGHGAAVLVRALEPLEGIELMRQRRPRARRDVDLTNGPGKLCAALGIDGRHSGMPLDTGEVRILRGDSLPEKLVGVSTRIGITKAADWPLRWFVIGDPYVSRHPAFRTRGAK